MAIARVDFRPKAQGGDDGTAALMKLDLNCEDLDERTASVEGLVASASGLRNKLMNSACRINNRRFAGGSLGVGVFGYDRWKAANSGTSLTVTNGVWSLTGSVLQSIERDASNVLDGQTVTVSVENPSGPVTVQLSGSSGAVNGIIPAGSGRRSTTLVMPATASAYHGVVLAVTGTQTFKNPQLELGSIATSYEQRDITLEDLLCARYCPAFRATSGLSVISMAQAATATQTTPIVRFTVRSRIPPTAVVVSSGSHFAVSQAGTANVNATSCVFGSASQDGAVLLTGGSSGLVPGNASILFFNNAAGWLYFEGCDF
jgi:hypothetical protein